jgi:hypothetical protein
MERRKREAIQYEEERQEIIKKQQVETKQRVAKEKAEKEEKAKAEKAKAEAKKATSARKKVIGNPDLSKLIKEFSSPRKDRVEILAGIFNNGKNYYELYLRGEYAAENGSAKTIEKKCGELATFCDEHFVQPVIKYLGISEDLLESRSGVFEFEGVRFYLEGEDNDYSFRRIGLEYIDANAKYPDGSVKPIYKDKSVAKWAKKEKEDLDEMLGVDNLRLEKVGLEFEDKGEEIVIVKM